MQIIKLILEHSRQLRRLISLTKLIHVHENNAKVAQDESCMQILQSRALTVFFLLQSDNNF